MMPATRAVSSTSPFLAFPETIRSSVALLMTTRPSAVAIRSVAGLEDTSTIRASPLPSIWVSAGWSFAACFDFLPAILPRPDRAGSGVAGEQGAGRSLHVALPHQAFADQEGRHADACKPRKVGGREDAAFADHQAVFRNQRRQRLARRQRGF